jgi:DNA-binding NtrC family response regulator
MDEAISVVPAHPGAAQTLDGEQAFVARTVAEVERDLILDTLRHCHGNRTRAAMVLGISVRTLRNKLHDYAQAGMPVPPPGGGEAADMG